MEIWCDIKGFKGLYKISNMGNIISLERLVNCKGNKKRLKKQLTVKQELLKCGYYRVTLSKNNTTKRYMVHRLVASHFLLNQNKRKIVNHKDSNKTNNNVKNLQWTTSRGNCWHYQNSIGNKNIGVSFVKGMNRYQVSVLYNNKKNYLGSFKDKESAIIKHSKFINKHKLKIK